MKKLKKIPKFKSEAEERKFWAKADSNNYIDWPKASKVSLPKLKPSTKTISIRLSEHLIEGLKTLANKKDIPYQSLIKIILHERINQELRNTI